MEKAEMKISPSTPTVSMAATIVVTGDVQARLRSARKVEETLRQRRQVHDDLLVVCALP
jgi:hypothetical protein